MLNIKTKRFHLKNKYLALSEKKKSKSKSPTAVTDILKEKAAEHPKRLMQIKSFMRKQAGTGNQVLVTQQKYVLKEKHPGEYKRAQSG